VSSAARAALFAFAAIAFVFPEVVGPQWLVALVER
jgi:hypothetical protein